MLKHVIEGKQFTHLVSGDIADFGNYLLVACKLHENQT